MGGSSSTPMTVFDIAGRGMSAQLVRMNAAASNLANAGTVSGSADTAYRPLRPVFKTELDKAGGAGVRDGVATVGVQGVYQSGESPVARYDPNHPLADADGNVWQSGVDENAEMVEMLDSSRQYQSLVEALTTAKQLMLDTMRMK